MTAPSTEQHTLITPYGGALVNLLVEGDERAALIAEASHLPTLQLSARALCDLELIATGGFSPLDRFMGQADYERVLGEMLTEPKPNVWFESGRAPRRLGHLVLGTPDIAATVALLTEGLGFKVSDTIDGVIAFLRCSTDHHNVAVVDSPVPQLQHYSWECDDIDHVGHTATALYRADPERQVWGMGRHFAGSNFYWYLRDPSGSFIELYSDLDQILDDDEWESNGRTEFTFEHVANAWGPNLPLEFIVPDDLDALQRGWEQWAR